MKCINSIRRQSGFGLVEILVALALGMILTTALIQVTVNSKQGFKIVESFNAQSDSGRIATQILGEAIIHAGHWGGLKAGDINAGASSFVASGSCNKNWITDTSQPIRAYDGEAMIATVTSNSGFPGNCIAAADYVANTDVLVVRYADPTYIARSAAISAGNHDDTLFVRTILADQNLGSKGEIFIGSDDVPTDLNTGDPMGTYNYAYRSDIYFIRPCSATVPSCDNIPTLVRMRYEGGGYQIQPLIDNVEQFQLAFGVDSDGDFNIDAYVAPSAVSDWGDVIAVRFDIVVRNDERSNDGFADSSTYTLAGGVSYTPSAPQNIYRRKVFSKLIQIRNLSRI